MIYELRQYVPLPHRCDVLLDRFEKLTLPVFDRLGFRVVGFWVTSVERHVVYVLAWESREEMSRKWQALRDDAAWVAGKETSEEHGPIVDRIESTLMERPPFIGAIGAAKTPGEQRAPAPNAMPFPPRTHGS